MVAIGSIKAWQPGRGPVTTWTASPASREIMARADRDPLPPSFQQADHLRTAYLAEAAGRDVPRLVMAAWDVDGWCDVAAMTVAINAHIRRHDTYHSAFDVDGDVITRRTIDNPNRIEFVPTALGFMDEDAIRKHVATATPGTLEWDCFTFGVVQKSNHFTVYANIDHLHTDGSSAVVIYRDIHLTYMSLIEDAPNPARANSGYRDFTARQRMQAQQLEVTSRPIEDWADFARESGRDGGCSFPLALGDSSSSTLGRVVTVELLNAQETEAFETACRRSGARFSGGVMACAALAEHELTGASAFHTLTPSDNRNIETNSHSVGWFASLFPVSVAVEDSGFSATARAAQKSFDANRHLSAVPAELAHALVAADGGSLPAPRKPSMMLSLFDFRNLEDANASGLGLYIDDLSRGDVNIWVTRNVDQTIVTVSFPDTHHARHSIHHYLGVLRSALLDASKATTGWAGAAAQPFAHSA